MLKALLKASPAGLSQEKLPQTAWDENTTRSPPPSRSQSAGYAANSETPEIIKTTPRHRLPHSNQRERNKLQHQPRGDTTVHTR